MKKNKQNLRELWDTNMCINILMMGVPEEEKREKGSENNYLKKLPKFDKSHVYTLRKLKKTLSKINSRNSILRQIIVKLTERKD